MFYFEEALVNQHVPLNLVYIEKYLSFNFSGSRFVYISVIPIFKLESEY